MSGNGKKYSELIEQIKEAKTQKEKIDYLSTMTFMVATNDLEHIYREMRQLRKRLYFIGGAILLAVLVSNQVSMTEIFTLLSLLARSPKISRFVTSQPGLVEEEAESPTS